MYKKCYRDGVVDSKIGKKGVLLARRDNSHFVKNVYENVINFVSENKSSSDILSYILEEINSLCSGCKNYKEFIITKSIGDCGNLIPVPFTDEKNVKKAMVGNYKTPLLSINPDIRMNQMAKKGAVSEEEFYLLCLPAQVQLAERMKNRGQRVDPGTRLEYLITGPNIHTAKQYEKVESADYYFKHRTVIKIDYLYYLKALVNPLDEVLNVLFSKTGIKNFVLWQYNYRLKIRHKLMNELKTLFRPKIIYK